MVGAPTDPTLDTEATMLVELLRFDGAWRTDGSALNVKASHPVAAAASRAMTKWLAAAAVGCDNGALRPRGRVAFFMMTTPKSAEIRFPTSPFSPSLCHARENDRR